MYTWEKRLESNLICTTIYHIMIYMKRSTILYWIILAMVAALVLVVIAVPQAVLDYYEIYFMLIYMPIMGLLWFRAYLDGIGGN